MKTKESYLLFNKNQQSILDNIKNFIEDLGSPLEFGFDNRQELINKSVESYLCNNNIKILEVGLIIQGRKVN